MSNIIYYFSGRGNTYRIAKDLAEKLGNTEIRFLGKTPGGVGDAAAECIGFVSPVIDFGIPSCVEKFLKQLKIEGKKPYAFSVLSCGGMPGAAMKQLQRSLKKAGLILNSSFTVKFGLKQDSEEEWNTRLDNMATVIRHRMIRPIEGITLKDKVMTGLLNPLARLMIPREDKKFKVNEKCNGCGTCTKVCPAGNISIKERKPVWKHKCEQCAACFAWCPKEAISGTNLAARTRYRNPHVKLDQILDR